TPLCWTAQNGHEAAVKTLLAQMGVNPNTADTTYGQTPLCWAAENGHGGVVKILLAREDVNPNTPNTVYGRTPLYCAARNGHEAVIKTLLAREDVSTDTTDNLNEMPLFWELSGAHNQIVTTLQEMISRSSDPAHDGGQVVTPQSAEHGQEYAAGMLCGGSDPGPDIADLEGPNVNLSTTPRSVNGHRTTMNDSSFPDPHRFSAEQNTHLHPPPSGRRGFQPFPEPDTHPHNLQSTLLAAFDRYFIISSFF
ncbi:ankyrin, partial [Choiromyces venosus 120613-1]